MSTTLLLGGSGQLGSAFTRIIGHAVTPTHSEVDLARLTHGEAAALLDAVAPDLLLNCAAWTAVDAAESAEQEAIAVNGSAVGILAEVADRRGIPFVTFSTDYVFDGTATRPYREDDTPSPVNAYGRSKLIGEELALIHPRSLVIRTSWVQSDTHSCFVRKMLELAEQGSPLRVVDDQTGRPTFARDLAEATKTAVDNGVTGLIHIANSGHATWYELASEAVRIAGFDAEVVPVSSSAFETAADRPANSVLDLTRMSDCGIRELPSWQLALGHAVETIMRMHQ